MPEAESATPEDRRDERTHLFVIGTLYFGRSSAPVRVRNLSATGALIEGTSLPHVGTEIILRRGDLKAKKRGRRTIILRDDLAAYLTSLPDYPAAA